MGFAACLNLGNFVPAMIAYTPFLIPAEDWDMLERWWVRSVKRVDFGARVQTRLSAWIFRLAALLTPGREGGGVGDSGCSSGGILDLGDLRMLTAPNVVSQEALKENRTFAALGIDTPTTMASVVPGYLERFQLHGQFAHYQG